MLSKNIRRFLSFVIALVMAFSVIPFEALHVKAEDHEIETQTTAAPESTAASELSSASNEAFMKIQTTIDNILTHYLGTTEISAADISAKVSNMDWETYQSARSDIYELENSDNIQQLTEAELLILLNDNSVLCAFSEALEAKAATDNEVSLLTTVNVLDGQVSVTDTANSNTVSNGTVTIKAAGSITSKKTNTVTITNETANTATLAFDYSASTYNSFTIAGASASASGTYSGLLEAGASVTLVLVSNSGLSNRTATLTLSNFSLTVAAANSNVTINYDSALGSVTAAGNAVSDGDEVPGVSLTDGIALVATANSGTTFLGWINSASGELLSKETTFTLIPTADVTVKAVFVGSGSAPWFGVAGATQNSESIGLFGMSKLYYYTVSTQYTHLFDDLNAAGATAAASGVNKYIVLLNSGTLPTGDYTIPAGVTLLIPFDSTNTLYTTAAQSLRTYTTPTAYRTLTMADGANLVINGSMSISAKHTSAAGSEPYYGTPTGDYGLVKTEGNSSITVNNGGSLYVYGYITGSGSVTAKSGATVYEMFQIMDFRGGTQSSDMENGVFPLSQYYVQNIEISLTLEHGAKEYGYTTVYASSSSFGTAVEFIGSSDCMFNMSSGSVIKSYDGTTDRLTVELKDGIMNIASIELALNNIPINSSEYDLAVNNNFTINLTNSDVTINQDLAVLPGAQINIDADSTCTLGSGINIYVYDSEQWGTFCSHLNKQFIPVSYAPGRVYTRTAADLVDAAVCVNGTVDASAGYIYTTAGGANIYSTGTGVITAKAGTQTVTHQLVQGTGYTEIPINSAWLKNSDASFVKAGTDTYTYVDGFWRCGTHSWGEDYLCSVCGQAMIRYNAINLSIVGEVKLNLKFEIEDSLITDGLTVYVTEEANAVAKNGDSWNKAVTADMLDSDKIRYVVSQGIAAGEMPGDVTVQFKIGDTVIPVYDKDSKSITTNPLVKNVRNYASQGLASDKQTLKDLCHWMVVYGGYAQQFFGTHTDDYMYDLVPENDRAVSDAVLDQKSTVSDGKIGIEVGNQRINLNSEIYMRTYFVVEDGHNIDEYTFTLTSPTDGGDAEIQSRIESGHERGNLYYVDIKNIPVAYWNDMYTITVTHSSGGTYSVTSSVLAWAARCVAKSDDDAQINMARAMYYYATAADAYFNAE